MQGDNGIIIFVKCEAASHCNGPLPSVIITDLLIETSVETEDFIINYNYIVFSVLF